MGRRGRRKAGKIRGRGRGRRERGRSGRGEREEGQRRQRLTGGGGRERKQAVRLLRAPCSSAVMSIGSGWDSYSYFLLVRFRCWQARSMERACASQGTRTQARLVKKGTQRGASSPLCRLMVLPSSSSSPCIRSGAEEEKPIACVHRCFRTGQTHTDGPAAVMPAEMMRGLAFARWNPHSNEGDLGGRGQSRLQAQW